MLRRLIVLPLVLLAIGLSMFWLATIPSTVPASALAPHVPNLDNGKAMFYAGGCASCHATPGQDDKDRLGGGLPLKSPFGTFHAPNISPDPKDGIGGWNEAQFVTAMTKGTSPDGRHYYPSFPYTSYQRMTTADLRDLFAYMKTLPVVSGKVREHDVPFPYDIRRSLGGWKQLFLDGQPFKPDPAQSAEWNRGAYLVNGPGHCAECHSPRNVLGGIDQAKRFAGGPDLEGQGWVPNITQKGLSNWSERDIVRLLENGELPDGDSVGGAMTPVVRNTAQLSPTDREAMAIYLKSLPPVDSPPRPEKK